MKTSSKKKATTLISQLSAVSLMAAVPMMAQAGDGYVGLQYGNLQSEDAEMGNVGFVGGYRFNDYFGVEAQLTQTISEENLGYGASLEADTQGIYATVQSSGKCYLKAKAGVAKVNYDLDTNWYSASGNQTGFSYGVGGGLKLGDRVSVELEYTELPELDKFAGRRFEASGSYTSLGFSIDL